MLLLRVRLQILSSSSPTRRWARSHYARLGGEEPGAKPALIAFDLEPPNEFEMTTYAPIAAAMLTLLLGVAHSWLGERYILIPPPSFLDRLSRHRRARLSGGRVTALYGSPQCPVRCPL